MSTPAAPPKPTIPEPPRFLTFLALLFVPGLYIVLFGSLAVVLGVGGGLVVGLVFALKEVHSVHLIVLAICLGCGVVLGAISLIKGIICSMWPHTPFEPAILIDYRREIDLGYVIAPLCSAMATRIPDVVVIHAEPTFFVGQGRVAVFNGKARGRILVIGLPMLAALTKGELRAILAHEFAHFSGRDTTYSTRIEPVYKGATKTLSEMNRHMANADSISERLPMVLPFHVLHLYLKIFHLIDMRISRSQELRADATAASVCGTQSVRMGLMKMYGVGDTFADDRAVQAARQAYPTRPFNYHIGFRLALPHLRQIANEHCARQMAQLDDPRSSHPSLKRRLDALPDFPERYNDSDSALSLLTNLPAYEKLLGEFYGELTSRVRH